MKFYKLTFLISFILYSICNALNYANDVYMPIAAAAYSDNPNNCWAKINAEENALYNFSSLHIKYSIYRQYSVRCDTLNDTCSAYIALDFLNPDYPNVYIAFRGTNNNYQLFEEGWDYNEMVPFVIGGKVGKYFFDGFNDIWNAGMKDDLIALKNSYSSPSQLISFAFLGHSLGGAMASLAAATFLKLYGGGIYYISLTTYGQPRTGDKDFAYAFNLLDFDVTRIIHKADIVPHLPPLNLSVYYHHVLEQWYPNDMENENDSIFCDDRDGEDLYCSDSLHDWEYNIKDHKYYYGREFSEYGINGCPDLGTSKLQWNNTRIKIFKKHFKPYTLKTTNNIKL